MNNKTIIGLIIILSSFWGGAYFMQLTSGTWAGFPTFATATVFMAIGVLLTAAGFCDDR
jgi:hypothetical protein